MSETPLHSRVALKDGKDQVYVYALAGTEGWVRGTKEDSDGFPLFKIEWDKEHWRYNGQPDGWTFAEHFKVIGPPDPRAVDDEEDEDEEVDEDVEMQDDPVSKEEALEAYMETLSEAFDAASEAEGFVVFTIRRVPNPEKPEEVAFVPTMFLHAASKEANMLLDVAVADAAATNYQEMILNLMQSIKPEGAE